LTIGVKPDYVRRRPRALVRQCGIRKQAIIALKTLASFVQRTINEWRSSQFVNLRIIYELSLILGEEMTGRLSNHVALATTEKSDPTPKIVPPQMLVYDQ
jgi:hypothetical protein